MGGAVAGVAGSDDESDRGHVGLGRLQGFAGEASGGDGA